jgi:hypothetical protein
MDLKLHPAIWFLGGKIIINNRFHPYLFKKGKLFCCKVYLKFQVFLDT